VDRRAFLGTLVGGLLAAPLATEAQKAGKVWRIGVIAYAPTTADMVGPDPKPSAVNALLRGLRELGYVYGQHFVTESRGAEGKPERFPGLVAELISLQVDVIVAVSASLPAVKQATSTIPVVFPGTTDPVGAGYAKSLARPGGNFTGLSFQSLELVVKRLELLKQLVPTGGPVAVLWDRAFPGQWAAVEAAARERRWKLLSLPILDVSEVDGAFRTATKARAGALLVTAGFALDPHPERVADLAATHRLPAMYHFRFYVERGGLACYAPDLVDIWRAAAGFVDKILKGAKPADLPVEQPTKFELVINLKTAKALGLTSPQSVLARADEVIQ
jgi:putative tryptophan/tyrosine transport system substrate-binding protein